MRLFCNLWAVSFLVHIMVNISNKHIRRWNIWALIWYREIRETILLNPQLTGIGLNDDSLNIHSLADIDKLLSALRNLDIFRVPYQARFRLPSGLSMEHVFKEIPFNSLESIIGLPCDMFRN